MKIGIYTTALGQHISGGILCIIKILNELVAKGHDCVCFLDHPPYRSDWLRTNFPIESSDRVKNYDGILVSPYSPTAEAVAKATNAEDRFYWVHTNESLFCHNGKEWQDNARRSYTLPLKIFCTSTYLQIIMETVFNRNVIGVLVPPGVDTSIFRPGGILQSREEVTVGILNRTEWVRGIDASSLILRLSQRLSNKVKIKAVGHVADRYVLANHYRGMDIFLDMSRVAGSPTPVKEAMACGAIPICTKYGTTDFILSDFNGYIVPVDNVESVANLIVLLADNYEKRMHIAENAVETMKRFEWPIIADQFIYAILEGKKRGDILLKERNWYIPK